MSELVSIERHDGIAVLRIERPPANAIDLDLCGSMERQLQGAMDGEPGALVLTGGSGPFFSGGLDLKVVPYYTTEQQRKMILAINRMVARLYSCPVPVVAAVNGHAIAGGLILAMIADYRVGPTGPALFGLTEARAGIAFPAGPMIVLQAEIPPHQVRQITLQARNFGPAEAIERGVLDEIRSPESVLERALEVAVDMATIPAETYRRIKHQVRAAAIARLEQLEATGDDPMLAGWLSSESATAAASILRGTSGA
jgi:enoyl-CoA hydratase